MAISIITGFMSNSKEMLDKRSGPYYSADLTNKSVILANLDPLNRFPGLITFLIDQPADEQSGLFPDNGNVAAFIFDGGITYDELIPFADFIGAVGVAPSGLEALDDGSGIGWRLIGQLTGNHIGIGLDSVDLTHGYDVAPSGASGDRSFAAMTGRAKGNGAIVIGQESEALGNSSVILGPLNTSIESNGIAIGYNNADTGIAPGEEAASNVLIGLSNTSAAYTTVTVGGWNNTVSGANYSTNIGMGNSLGSSAIYNASIGLNLTGINPHSLTMGVANIGISLDTKVEIGIGVAFESTANGLEIYNDGAIVAPGSTIDSIDNFATNHAVDHAREPDLENRILVTKEYADTNYVSKASDIVIHITYIQLKILRTGGLLETGKRYIITDYKTTYQQPESLVTSSSAQGIADGLDTAVEQLMVLALSPNTLSVDVVSLERPSDLIKYNIDLDLTGGTDSHTGGIYYRKDTLLNIEMRYDWRTIKFRRYALTADAWDSGTTYAKGDTCRIVNRLFVALEGSNLNNDPLTTDGDKWMTVFYDVTSRPDLEYNTAQSTTPPVEDRLKTFGFKVDGTKYKDYYTVAFLDEPDNSTCVHVGTGKSIAVVSFMNTLSLDSNGLPYYWELLANNIIMLENTNDMLTYSGNISISGTSSFYWNTFRPYVYMGDVTISGSSYIRNTFISGLVYNVNISNIFKLENSFIRGLSYLEIIEDGIYDSILNIQADDLSESRMVNNGVYTAVRTHVYTKAWIHGIPYCVFRDCTISRDAKITNSNKVDLINSFIYGDMTSTSVFTESGYYRTANGSASGLVINGSVLNSVLVDTSNLVVDGTLNGVELRQVKDVIIPANVSLTEVKFDVPVWSGKNTWSGSPLTLVNKRVTRKWEDIPGDPTEEKLWYEEIDQNGTVTYKELK